MSKYASKTTVPVDRSRTQIEKLLERYGASSFMYGWEAEIAVVAFQYERWGIRFKLPMPPKEQFRRTDRGRPRSSDAVDREHAQAMRQRWRALHLVIQAKLEAVECGITTFEEEFLSHIVTPNGLTVGETILPALEEAVETGKMPRMLIAGI